MSKGVQYMLISTLFFGAMSFLIKLLSHIPFYEIVFFRSIITLVLTYGLLKKARLNPLGHHKKWLLARGFTGFATLTVFFYTLQQMSLASAVTLQYLAPIFTTVFAIFMLKQSIFPLQWVFFAIAFGGVFLVKGFDETVTNQLLILGILAAMGSGFSKNIIAKLKGKDHPYVIIFYFPLVTLPFITPYTLTHFVVPNTLDIVLLLITGLVTQFAQVFMTRAYQLERAANISIFTYLGLLYALILGKLVFHDSYSAWAIVGMLCISGGIIANVFYVRYRNRNAAST